MAEWLNRTRVGDCRALLPAMAADGVRVQTCITSPPYFGLRDYGHEGQIGLEDSPVAYVAALVEVFRAVRDVLADDGTLWLNLGDSYASSGGTGQQGKHGDRCARTHTQRALLHSAGVDGLKPKDLIGMPWRVAFALQSDGWYLRSDIIWHKPNPMPESVTDRPTKAHEYVFLLAKSERYYYDAEAIKEGGAGRTDLGKMEGIGRLNSGGLWASDGKEKEANGRNRRTVWTVATEPFEGAHFACFPRALIEPCILAGCRGGGTVLDPFMGSGTTGQVATNLGRNFIGCELNDAYIDLHDMRKTTIGFDFDTEGCLPPSDTGDAALAPKEPT